MLNISKLELSLNSSFSTSFCSSLIIILITNIWSLFLENVSQTKDLNSKY
jgi:hypothetical protein